MSPTKRALLGVAILAAGLGAEAALERATTAPRPPLKRPLATIPAELGDWVGRDVAMDPKVLEETQADDYLNRVYEDRRHPGRSVTLWINYSRHGLNLRHSPEVCLPSSGWELVESRCREMALDGGRSRMTRLGYKKGELAQTVGFWYYIFGEGRWEHYVRSLPITSRSSHGRTTRGSGLTVEVFAPGEADGDAEATAEFAGALLGALEPLLPEDRAQYHIP
jgi:EpsI family protein